MRSNHHPLTLALDSGSPTISIALGAGRELLAQTSYAGGSSSPPLLGRVHDLLSSISATPRDLERLIALRGPGSFTGLRSGLATILGLHQALEIPATAMPTFLPLAEQIATSRSVIAAVDALRGEWFAQPFRTRPTAPVAPPSIVSPEELVSYAPCTVVAFGSRPLRAALSPESGIEVVESNPLAPTLLTLTDGPDLEWRAERLIEPLYLRPPATRLSQRGL